MLEFIRNITSRRNEDGASAVEYGLLVAGIAALIVAIVFLFGGVIKDAFQSTCNRVKQGSATLPPPALTPRIDDPGRSHDRPGSIASRGSGPQGVRHALAACLVGTSQP